MRSITRICLLGSVVATLAACGSSSSKTNTSSTGSGSSTTAGLPANSMNAAIAAEVPAAIKQKGTLTVAADASYAPNEFIASDGHTVIGMDPDLMKALGTVMGLKVNVVNAPFETIIPGLAGGRYDVGASSFTDTKEREKTVDFVTYLSVGQALLTKSSGPHMNALNELCGHTVAVEKGTIEQENVIKVAKTCPAGVNINLQVYTDQNGANLALQSGRAEVDYADSPIIAYQVRQLGVNVRSSPTFTPEPYGLAVPKNNGMAKPMLEALKVLMKNGTYAAILKRWQLQSAAITEPVINGAKS
jgi:polar amino acid transport system substrate-binding protein